MKIQRFVTPILLMMLILLTCLKPTAVLGGAYPDYGDAPDTYGTVQANDGARHSPSSLYLGTNFDLEADGQPNATATGDDTNGLDDEDGVVLTSKVLRCRTLTMDVTASAAGKLDAWIDYNQDGDWGDAGEKVFDNFSLSAGVNHLSTVVPCEASLGTTFARFRLSTAGGLVVTGFAADGEVEDYQVEITEAPVPGQGPKLLLLGN